MHASRQEPIYTVRIPAIGTQDIYRYPKSGDDIILLSVKKVPFFVGQNYAEVTARSGDKYVITNEDSGYSKMVIRLVSQIMRLNNIPSDP